MPSGVVDKTFLYSEETRNEIEKVTEKLNPMYAEPLKQSPTELWRVPFKEIVNIAPQLIQQKVLADVLYGAQHNKNWKDWVNLVDMDTPQVAVPVLTEEDFIFRKGTKATLARYMGGRGRVVQLDCSEDRGLWTGAIGIKKTWIKDSNWNTVGEATKMAGQAAYLEVAREVIAYLDTNAVATDTFVTDMYVSIARSIANMRAAGFQPTIIIVPSSVEGLLMSLDAFISIEKLGRVGRLAEEGTIGNFYGTIPVYSTGDTLGGFSKVTTKRPLVVAQKQGVVLGLRQDLQIEEYDEPLKGLEGAVLTMRFDIKLGFSSAIRRVATS